MYSSCSFSAPAIGNANIVARKDKSQEDKEVFDGIINTNTRRWKEYRNKEYGFNFRYPTTWYCGRPALENKITKSIACMEFEETNQYYESSNSINTCHILVNIVDSEAISDLSEQDVFSKTFEIEDMFLEVIYFNCRRD